MKNLLLLLFLSLPAFPQCGKLALNPITGKMDCIGTASASAGTVTSVSATCLAWLNCPIATATTTPALAIGAASAQTSHQVIGTCGSATSFGPCPLTLSDLPASPHVVTFNVNGGGSAITAGPINQYVESEIASMTGIYKVVVTGTGTSGPSTCTLAFDVWKHAAGTVPVGADKISASDPAALSTVQNSVDTTLTGWATAVAVGDLWGGSVAASPTPTCASATVQIWYK